MKKTSLYDYHKENGHLEEFAGFEMPLWYSGTIEEHLSVRNSCGIFDVSHMGRLIVTGKEAAKFLDFVLTINCSQLKPLLARQAFICNSHGGIIDDILIFRLEEEKFLLVVNAFNTEKDIKWIEKNLSTFEVQIKDVTNKVSMIAIQGPRAVNILQTLTEPSISLLKYLSAVWNQIQDRTILISRTGYTGEDGFELYISLGKKEEDYVNKLWNRIIKLGGIPCGLAARDTLRLEAGLCLNGNELNEDITPIEAQLKYGVNFDGRNFIGKDALLKQWKRGVSKKRIGFKMLERGIPRKGMEIAVNDEKIGLVSSGTFSPILKIGIGMGYIHPKYSKIGTNTRVIIRKNLIKAKISKLPFYDKEIYGRRRKK